MKLLCTLPSSDGWTSFSCALLARNGIAGDREIITTELTFRGQFWDREALERLDKATELVEDFDLRLCQFVTSEAALHGLTAQLGEWLATPKEIEIELTDVKHLDFSISFRPEKGIISRIDRPVCTIICACERLPRLEVKFVVDQSCIRLFRDELAAALEQLPGP